MAGLTFTRDGYPSFASIVIFAFNTLDTGQPAFAFCAAVLKASALAPGTFATTSRCTAVMVQPASCFSIVSVADVLMLSGVRLAPPSCADSAIEKHAACAAAISSSGFVPGASSNRVLKEYFVFERMPLADETVPCPSLRPPFHTALALRCMVSSSTQDELRLQSL